MFWVGFGFGFGWVYPTQSTVFWGGVGYVPVCLKPHDITMLLCCIAYMFVYRRVVTYFCDFAVLFVSLADFVYKIDFTPRVSNTLCPKNNNKPIVGF